MKKRYFLPVAIFGFVVVCSLTLLLWFLLNSKDIPDFHSQFEKPISRLADNDNAYLQLKLDRFKSNDPDVRAIDTGVLQKHISGEAWNNDFVENVSFALADEISSVKSLHQFERFSTPFNPQDPLLLPAYGHLVTLFRAHLLHAVRYEKLGQYGDAITAYSESFTFLKLIMSDQNLTLVGYMVGLVLHYDLLHQIYRLSSNGELEDRHLLKLNRMLGEWGRPTRSEFVKMMSNEFYFFSFYIDRKHSASAYSLFNHDHFFGEAGADSLADHLMLNLFQRFPNFYVHHNRSLRKADQYFNGLLKRFGEACDVGPISKECSFQESAGDIRLIDVVTPNSLGVRISEHVSVYESYFARRCFAYTQVEALKAIVAIKRFEREHGAIPHSLDELVPQYLDVLSQDYFSRQPLKFSSEKGWLYSVGLNREDDQGSEESFYHYKCIEDACAYNPTFKIDFSLPGSG